MSGLFMRGSRSASPGHRSVNAGSSSRSRGLTVYGLTPCARLPPSNAYRYTSSLSAGSAATSTITRAAVATPMTSSAAPLPAAPGPVRRTNHHTAVSAAQPAAVAIQNGRRVRTFDAAASIESSGARSRRQSVAATAHSDRPAHARAIVRGRGLRGGTGPS